MEAKSLAAEGGFQSLATGCSACQKFRESLPPRRFFVKFPCDSVAGTATFHDGSFAAFQGDGNKQETPRASTPLASRHGSEIPRIFAS